MGKMDELVMVVKRRGLFGRQEERLQYFKDGFCRGEDCDFFPFFSQCEFLRRGDMEQNPLYKQLIAYCAIVNPTTKRVFAYQRQEKGKQYQEDRLAGNWSWGFGGHVHPDDERGNPLLVSLARELDEETTIKGDFKAVHYGYINDDTVPQGHDPAKGVPVGQVHFGIFYVFHYEGNPEDLRVRSEAKHGEWLEYRELEEIAAKNPKVDSWSRIALGVLKKVLS